MKETLIADNERFKELIDNLADDLIAKNNLNEIALVGIQTRGVPLAKMIADSVHEKSNTAPLVGSLDISLYRDDLSEIGTQPRVGKTQLSFDVKGRGLILVDDVLYTGRTIRAAMDELIDFGRPKFIKLLVIVDRGWREFPIQADYVGLKIDTTLNDNIKVMVKPIDPECRIVKRTKE